MKTVFKKTIFLLTLAVIVFLVGGVGVVRAAENPPVVAPVTPASPAPDAQIPEQSVGLGKKGDLEIIGCGGFWDKLTLSCVLPVLTYSLYVVTAGVLTLSGYLFDFMLNLGIDRDFIIQPFVNKIWVVMRDFSNMMFIFILLYTGIRTMLWGDDWKKPVMMVVVIALLINFSLFFTKIVIDAGNVLAVGVYSGMGVGEGTSVSAAFTNGFSPQQFFSLSADKMSLAPTIFIIAGIVSGFLAFVLFKAAFMFMGRILAFWFLMALSPFAFILLAFPQLGAKIKFSFGAWLDMLINQAMVAPVFLFFIYMVMTVVQDKVFTNLKPPFGSSDLTNTLFVPVVVTGMIIFALKKSLSVAESMSGEFGKIGADLGNKALGLGLGVASGGATMAIGGAANKMLGSGALQGMAGSERKGTMGVLTRFAGRQGIQLSKGLEGSIFDPRNIKFGGIGKGLGAGAGNKENFKQREEKWAKEQQKKAKDYEMTEGEKEKTPESKTFKENTKKRDEAEKTYKKAEEAVANSVPVKQKKEAVGKANERKSSAVTMAGDATIKKIEAQERTKVASGGVQKAKAIEELEEAEEEERKALDELRDAKEEAGKAEKAYNSSDEVTALKEATKNLAEISEIVKGEKKAIEKKVADENARRRGVHGKSATLTNFYGWFNRQRKIEKIRKGPSDEEKAEESAVKTLKKLLDKEKAKSGKPKEDPKKEEPKEPVETK